MAKVQMIAIATNCGKKTEPHYDECIENIYSKIGFGFSGRNDDAPNLFFNIVNVACSAGSTFLARTIGFFCNKYLSAPQPPAVELQIAPISSYVLLQQ